MDESAGPRKTGTGSSDVLDCAELRSSETKQSTTLPLPVPLSSPSSSSSITSISYISIPSPSAFLPVPVSLPSLLRPSSSTSTPSLSPISPPLLSLPSSSSSPHHAGSSQSGFSGFGSFLPDGCPRSSTPLRPCAPVFIPGVLVERDVTGATPQNTSNPSPLVFAGLGLSTGPPPGGTQDGSGLVGTGTGDPINIPKACPLPVLAGLGLSTGSPSGEPQDGSGLVGTGNGGPPSDCFCYE